MQADRMNEALFESMREAIDPGMMDAAYALHRYPLYRYAVKPAEDEYDLYAQVFCLAETAQQDAYPLLGTMLWCGQMLDYRLHVRMVTDDGQALRARLERDMPLLSAYSNLCGGAEEQYVDFQFVTETRLQAAIARGTAGSKRRVNIPALSDGYAGFTAILLGGQTQAFVEGCIEALEGLADGALILGLDAAAARDEALRDLGARRNVHFLREERKSEKRAAFERWLMDKAYRHHLLYADSRHGLNNIEQFSADREGIASSMAAALHMAYKLRSIGLDPDAPQRLSLAEKYVERVLGESDAQRLTFNALTALEHRRWIMYQAVNGWRSASIDQCRSYCFTENNGLGTPIYKFKINVQQGDLCLKLHPALVPGSGTMCLSGLTHAQWDRFGSDEEIDATDYDPLGKVSLKLHLVAREKLESNASVREAHLKQLRSLAGLNPDALKAYETFAAWFTCEGMVAHRYGEEQDQFDLLASGYGEAGISQTHTASLLKALKNDLRIVNEFYSYNNYETFDSVYIQHLAEIYCRPEHIELIKLGARSRIDNVTSALLLEPDCFCMVGASREDAGRAQQLIATYTTCERFECIEPKPYAQIKTLVDRMRSLVRSRMERLGKNGVCLIDVTDAPEDYAYAAWRVKGGASGMQRLGIIRSSSENLTMENLDGFPAAAAFSRTIRLRVKEHLALYGVHPDARDQSEQQRRYLLGMRKSFQKAFDFYLEARDDYCAFVKLLEGKAPKGYALSAGAPEKDMSRTYHMAATVISRSGIRNVLNQLQLNGLITDVYGATGGLEVRAKQWVHDALHCVFARLEGGCSGKLSIVSEGDHLLICQSRPASPAVYSWAQEEDASDCTLQVGNCTLYDPQAAQLRSRIAKPLWTSGLISSYTIFPNRPFTLSGKKKVVEPFMRALVDVNSGRVPCNQLRVDIYSQRIYQELPEGLEDAREDYCVDVPLTCSVPEDGIPCAYFGKIKRAQCRRTMRRRIVTDAGLSGVLDAMGQSKAYNFTWAIEEDARRPEEVTVCLEGEEPTVSALEGLLDEVERDRPGSLVWMNREKVVCPRAKRSIVIDSPDPDQLRVLKAAREAGVISFPEGAGPSVEITFCDEAIAYVFKDMGYLLECYTWYQAYAQDFDDVVNGYLFLWGNETGNEVDVLATKGLRLMMISCKMTPVMREGDENSCKYNMYEIRTLANQFSKGTRAVLLYLTTADGISDELQRRAYSIGTSLLLCNPEKNKNALRSSLLGGKLYSLMTEPS